MRVVVTGASGRLGRAVVALLQERHPETQVVRVDREPAGLPAGQSRGLDLCDLGQVYGVLAGAQAVIHLGAIPWPGDRAPEVVFANNVLGQFHIFEAAAVLGIARVVSASSVSALGFPFQHRWSEPLYLPIDEAHPLLPQDAYGLSKATGEHIADAYVRRGAGSATSLRFGYILDHTNYQPTVDAVRADPASWAPYLWSYTDLRDAADACVRALHAPYEGHEALFITAADTLSETPTDVLAERYFPLVPRHPRDQGARWSLLDGARSATILGYRPRYTWHQALTG